MCGAWTLQRTALTPADFATEAAAAERILGFPRHYQALAHPLNGALPDQRPKSTSFLSAVRDHVQDAVVFDLLVIHGVVDYSIEGRGENLELLNEIEYDADAKRLYILADAPLRIRCNVRDFGISFTEG